MKLIDNILKLMLGLFLILFTLSVLYLVMAGISRNNMSELSHNYRSSERL